MSTKDEAKNSIKPKNAAASLSQTIAVSLLEIQHICSLYVRQEQNRLKNRH